MKGELLRKLLENLNEFVSERNLTNKTIVIFGANAPATIMINFLGQYGIDVHSVIDNNELLHGRKILDITITSPSALNCNISDEVIVLIASKYFEEMKYQLLIQKLVDENSIIQILDFNENVRFDLSLDTIKEMKEKVIKGMEVYIELKKKYFFENLVMCSEKPNGDVYMIGSYFAAYCSVHRLENVLVTVIGMGCYKISQLFGMQKVEVLTLEQSDNLLAFANLYQKKILVANPYSSHLERYSNVDGYKDFTFIDSVKYGLLNLPNECDEVTRPQMQSNIKFEDYFKENNLMMGKTVVLAPYANSIPQIKWEFWEWLAESLMKKGFSVCTNCMPNVEQPIKGTYAINIDFKNIVEFLNLAGYVVAYRSGFCDIISSTMAKKIIIYPEHYVGSSSLRIFFGMEDQIYTQEKLIQIENIYNDTKGFLERVLEEF